MIMKHMDDGKNEFESYWNKKIHQEQVPLTADLMEV